MTWLISFALHFSRHVLAGIQLIKFILKDYIFPFYSSFGDCNHVLMKIVFIKCLAVLRHLGSQGKYSVISLFISGLNTSFWQRFQVFLFPTLPCMGWNLIFKPSSAFSVIIKEMYEFFAMFTFDIIVNETKSFLYWCVNVRYWFSLTTFNSIIFSKSHNASQNIPGTFSSITKIWFTVYLYTACWVFKHGVQN